QINAGDSTTLSAAASDPDGDPLSYSWSSDCAGSFDDASRATPKFTLASVPASQACTFTVDVLDGAGGSNHGNLTISAAGPAPVAYGPTFDSASQSSTTA